MERKKHYVFKLSFLIIIIFVAQQLFSNFTNIFFLDGKVFSGELYKLVTAIFLHGSIQHLLYNLFALLFFGFILENSIGSKKFLLVFLTTGIAANAISVYFYPSSLGASGSIMGVIGVITVLRPLMTVWAFSIPMPMIIASILWTIGDIIGVFIPDGVGNIAHLSGIFLGIMIGIFYRKKKKEKEENQIHIPEDIMRNWEMTYLIKRN